MLTTWKLRSVLGIVAALGYAVLCAAPHPAEARPQYAKEFLTKYPGLKAEANKVKNCGVCHGGDSGADKKTRNDYGETLMSMLGGVNVKPAEEINAALDKAAAEKSGSDGKTYGELIQDGKLPGKTVAAE
ncbi:MAG: hypothetical protein WD069_11125 [Planctomycetales bacterium]